MDVWSGASGSATGSGAHGGAAGGRNGSAAPAGQTGKHAGDHGAGRAVGPAGRALSALYEPVEFAGQGLPVQGRAAPGGGASARQPRLAHLEAVMM